jgi:hypothetical protein
MADDLLTIVKSLTGWASTSKHNKVMTLMAEEIVALKAKMDELERRLAAVER